MNKTMANDTVIAKGTTTADAVERFVQGNQGEANESPQKFASRLLGNSLGFILDSCLPEDMQAELKIQLEELQLRYDGAIDVSEIRELIPVIKEFGGTVKDTAYEYRQATLNAWIENLNHRVAELPGGSRVKLGRILKSLDLMTEEDRKSFTSRELGVIDFSPPIVKGAVIGILEQISDTLPPAR